MLGLFKSDVVGRDVVLNQPLRQTCAAVKFPSNLPSKSFTTRLEAKFMTAFDTSPTAPSVPSQPGDGQGCHAGAPEMKRAAAAAGKSEILEQYAKDYPVGPHDQPQSMCPAFGSLRVGLRMRRTATVLSGSACCVYGLTFTSHFYGAKRTVGYVPFNSETLVTGKLFEDIRDAVFKLADPALYDTIVVTNLCVPTASGVPLRLLPKEINGVRIIGIDVPGFGVPTHAEAKDVLAGAMLRYARGRRNKGRCRHRARNAQGAQNHVPGRDVSGRPCHHRHDAGAARARRRSCRARPANGASSMRPSTARRRLRSILFTRLQSVNSRPRAGRSSAALLWATTARRVGSTLLERPAVLAGQP